MDSAITLYPEDARMTTFPIFRTGIFEMYQRALRCHWTVGEVDISADYENFVRLSPQMKHMVEFILAFFAASDGIVNVNIVDRFKKDIAILEVGYFYNSQMAMEDIHAHMYSLLLDAIVPDEERRHTLFNAFKTIPVIQKMTDYIYETINSDLPLANRLLRMACVEGIFFSGCFAIIYWLQSKGLMPGFGISNEFIARDEGLHTEFSCMLFQLCNWRPDTTTIHAIVDDAVKIALEFAAEAIQEGIPEMNLRLMTPYIQTCADNYILGAIGAPALYKTTHSFGFMKQINVPVRSNFFERRVSDYSKPRINNSATKSEILRDF